jgi:2-polyprenyl-3-methyl-5-hydroxy-6-metoxy-1,4-benzoquinol methylase
METNIKLINSPQVWDNVWKETKSKKEYQALLKEERDSVRWRRIKAAVKKSFKSFKGLKVIEVGSGLGTYSALMAKEGAKVSLLDYSDKALQEAKLFLKANNVQATFIKADALKLPQKLMGKYDISMSFGLTEHFIGKNRVKINKVHFDLVRDNGMVVLSFPNKNNLPYRFFKYATQKLKTWPFGIEIPYSKQEFMEMFHTFGIRKIQVEGDSLFWSLNFINPFILISRVLNKLGIRQRWFIIGNQHGTFLDKYISFAYVVMVQKEELPTKKKK